jgi:transposase
LTPLELRHLQLLLAVRGRAHESAATYDEQLEDFVLECREAGSSARGMAETLGVGASTIQTWTTNARRRRQARGG